MKGTEITGMEAIILVLRYGLLYWVMPNKWTRRVGTWRWNALQCAGYSPIPRVCLQRAGESPLILFPVFFLWQLTPTTSDIVRFFYAKRPVYQQKLLIFSDKREHRLNSCPVVYADYADITANRRRLLRFKAAGCVISKAVQDWTEDPILASILISVAQKQAHRSISNSSNNATDFLPRSSYTASFLVRICLFNYNVETPS